MYNTFVPLGQGVGSYVSYPRPKRLSTNNSTITTDVPGIVSVTTIVSPIPDSGSRAGPFPISSANSVMRAFVVTCYAGLCFEQGFSIQVHGIFGKVRGYAPPSSTNLPPFALFMCLGLQC